MKNTELEQLINDKLNSAAISDYAPNGLQVEGKETVHKIVTGVTASQALLDEAANGLRQDGLAVETVLLESGAERVSEQIAKQAEASACDLVILGTHGRRGVDRLLLGSDAEQIARIAPVPVMLVREPHRKGIT